MSELHVEQTFDERPETMTSFTRQILVQGSERRSLFVFSREQGQNSYFLIACQRGFGCSSYLRKFSDFIPTTYKLTNFDMCRSWVSCCEADKEEMCS